VVIGLLAVSRDADRHWPCYTFQIMNFCAATQSRWGPAGHFWSLAAEEQFYLLWPLAVLFLNRRTLIAICWILIALAPIYRAAATSLTHDIYANTMLTGVMDCLAAGALLALAPSAFPRRFMFAAGLIGCELAVLIFRFDTVSVLDNALSPTLLLPLLCWLVAGASQGFQGALGQLLSHPALRYIGRISYGMYVIHYFTIPLLALVLPASANPYLRSLALGALTIILASLSWHFLERPINRMRDRLPSTHWSGRTAATADVPEIPKPLGTEATPATVEK
jgi:peptidoglycan/LPS O-acetylase OafA/YrhL